MKQEPKEERSERASDNEEFARFDDFVKRIMTVPKKEIDKKAAEYEKEKSKRNLKQATP